MSDLLVVSVACAVVFVGALYMVLRETAIRRRTEPPHKPRGYEAAESWRPKVYPEPSPYPERLNERLHWNQWSGKYE